jgi:hypothetical protein
MKRYRFEVHEELITPIEVIAESEQESRDRIFRQDNHRYPIRGDTWRCARCAAVCEQ